MGDPPPVPTRSEWETAVGIVADRLGVGHEAARVILARLGLPAILRALPEAELRRLAGMR
jgi:hypothetical protein